MPHAIWKGNIRFGLVNIPVDLYPAESPDDLNLDLLDRRDMARIGYERTNKSTGRKVPQSEVVKGYEVTGGHYVVVTDKDLRSAAPEATQTVDIVAFVNADEVSPIHYDKPYYLAPSGKGNKAYALLRESLKRSGRIGIARLVVRTRGYVAAVYPLEKVLVVQLLRYASELRDPDAYDVPSAGTSSTGVTAKELELAERLIEGMVEPWKPEEYKDEYRSQLLSLIRKKAKKGAKAVAEEEEEEPQRPEADVVDLMALLKQSVSGGKGGGREAAPGKRQRRTQAAPKASPARAKRTTGSSRPRSR